VSEALRRIGTGSCFILVPLILIFGFGAHPNLTDLGPPGSNVERWVGEFHGNELWRLAHVAVMWATIPIAVLFLEWMRLLREKAPLLSLVAGAMGIVGSFMLAADKGALALVPTAFDTLPEEQFRQMLPGLQAMIEYKGYLWMAQLYLLIPAGLFLMGIALAWTDAVPRWQGAAVVLGGLLLFNPDVDLISLIASIVLGVGLVPMGVSILKSGIHDGDKRGLRVGYADRAAPR
jgi:Domain of unknown function (DUF4386)